MGMPTTHWRDRWPDFLERGALLGRPDGRVQAFLVTGSGGEGEAPALYSPDFFLPHRGTAWHRLEDLGAGRDALAAAIHELEGSSAGSPVSELVQALDEGEFRARVEESLSGIREGRWSKVVPYGAERWRVGAGPGLVARLLSSLLRVEGPLWTYAVWGPEGGMAGATPELLFERRGRSLRTMALAGTRPGGTGLRHLLDDPKQRDEHGQVVEHITGSLDAFGEVAVSAPEVLLLPGLEHLRTDLAVSLHGDPGFEDLVRALHPTPALGSWPRGAADGLLRTWNERTPRHRFGAPFGLLGPDGEQLCLVAIRSVQWRGEHAQILAGCGVVRDSVPDDEWRELQAKVASVRRVFGWEAQ